MPRKKYEYWITDEGITVLIGFARNGFTTEEIAKKIGISRKTLVAWRKKYNNVNIALSAGFEQANMLVENALFKTAVGFYYTEETSDKDGNVIPVKKYQKPSPAAQRYWLKNRDPLHWRDRTEISAESTVNIENKTMDDKVLEQSDKILRAVSANNSLVNHEVNEMILNSDEYEIEDMIDEE